MAGLNYDDIKKKLGIKVIPNQNPIVKVVEEEKLVEPSKPDTVIPEESDTIAEDERKYYEFQTNKSLPETPFENKNNSSSTKEEIIEFKTEAERKFKQDLLLFERKFKQEFPLLMKLLIKIKNYIIKLMKI